MVYTRLAIHYDHMELYHARWDADYYEPSLSREERPGAACTNRREPIRQERTWRINGSARAGIVKRPANRRAAGIRLEEGVDRID